MKYIGIDYGTKRVGIAVSDEEGKMAFPYDVFPADEKLIQKIKEVCTDRGIGAVVIGESKNFAGDDNAIMNNIKKFSEKLKKEIGLPIIFEPEFLTSAQASRIQGNVAGLDASAATIILQSFLDRIKREI
jgi:putative Holliday junction resolvase